MLNNRILNIYRITKSDIFETMKYYISYNIIMEFLKVKGFIVYPFYVSRIYIILNALIKNVFN